MEQSIKPLLAAARQAAGELLDIPGDKIDNMLRDLSQEIVASTDDLLRANALDLERMDPDDPKYDRLKLTASRIKDIAADTAAVASLPSPLDRVIETWERPGGMNITKVSVPFGVIGAVYEARPNVTFDIFSLCVKAGSATLLKGGSDARDTNQCAIDIIRRVLQRHDLSADTAILLPVDHEATLEMLRAVGNVDLVIPRGSRRLIDFVRANTLVPFIETGAGVCHTYVHADARLDYAREIVDNAKTRRVSVCNALDTLIIDSSRLADLSAICEPLAKARVTIHADSPAFDTLSGHYPLLEKAVDKDYGREWLGYSMTIKTVDGLDEAIDYINRHGSRHSECIVTDNAEAAECFSRRVDAACVYTNVSTAFTDGGQFGFGAEIGISTQKLHARGPMALKEITTYKYLISGPGLTRHP